MEIFSKTKLLIKTKRSDIGLFILRIGLTFAFVAHSANLFMNILPSGLTSVFEVQIFCFALVELLCAIMILSGFLVSIASYTLSIVILFYFAFAKDVIGFFGSEVDRNNTYAFLLICSSITIALVGPGKFVLNKRYGHIASSMRESGIDKETEIMGT